MKAFFLSFLSSKNRQHYVALMRLNQPIGTYLLWVPCLWGLAAAIIAPPAPYYNDFLNIFLLSILFGIGSLLMRGAGCVINDYFDRDFDKMVERTKNRPLASGALPHRHALYFFFVLCGISSLILIFLSKTAIIIACFSIVPVMLYPLMKRITYWPQIFLGLVFNIGILVGYSAITDTLSLSVLWLYGAAIFHTIGYDSIYAFQDIEDDMKIGVKSSAQRIQNNPKIWIFLFYTAFVFMVCGFYHQYDALYHHYAAIVIFWLFLIYQIYDWHVKSAESSLKYFKMGHYNNIIVIFLILYLYI